VFALVLVISVAAAAVAIRFGASPVWIVPVVMLVSTVPHALVAYHLSGLEVDRHALEAALLLRVGALILALFELDALLTAIRARRAPVAAPRSSAS
jgi:hypothetical protein